MYFTTMNSFNEIINYPNVNKWMRFLFMEESIGYFPNENRDMPLREASFLSKTPWGDDLRDLSNQFVDTANVILDIINGRRKVLHLRDWKEWEPQEDADIHDADNIFVITPVEDGTVDKRPCMIICPGGAYLFVSFQNEGFPIANLATNHGYRSFMINYRTNPNANFPNPQMDLLETIKYIRENADKYHVDKDNVTAVGFSAGAHLVGCAAGVADELLPEGKPNAVVLGYPVITLKDEYTHFDTQQSLVGNDSAMKVKYSVEELVNEYYPKTFAWACDDDDCVPAINTRLLEKSLEAKGVEHECHIYPTGGHGCGLAFANSAHEWSRLMFEFLKKNKN